MEEEINKVILRMKATVKEWKLHEAEIRERFPEEEELSRTLEEKASRTSLSGRELEKGFSRPREPWRRGG